VETTLNTQTPATPTRTQLESVIIRFAGDSGDGMQLTGTRFTETAALAGNDIATLPDYPAEIRAPAGSLAGVSGFQLQFSSEDIFTAGDHPHVLIAMNPAALRRNLSDLAAGTTLVLDEDQFTPKNLQRAGFEANPLEDGTLETFVVHKVPITKMTVGALESITELTSRDKERCKNFFSLGLSYWMFGRSLAPTQAWIDRKFGDTPVGRANALALQKGYDFGITAELGAAYEVPAARDVAPGVYRSITGNMATAYGFAAAAHLAQRDLVLASYPITPASDILHALSALKGMGIRTIQAEDEIAAVCMAIGASYGGAIGLTTSSGPGIALKSEAISLALSAELPLVVANVQRAGPSTGMPTKVEQADLLQSLYGRHGEAPLVVVAPGTPSECFSMAIEAVRLATKYMTPVIYLSDAYIANGAEPWKVPDVSALPSIRVSPPPLPTEEAPFVPFARDPETLARAWAVPGMAGMEHRVGGLEKEDGTGNISYDPANHQRMTDLREEKIARIAHDIPPLDVEGDRDADLLVLGWGSTYGATRAAVARARRAGHRLAHAHFRYLSPFPANTEEVLRSFSKVLIPEVNQGQLARVLRGAFGVDITSYTRTEGRPFRVSELYERMLVMLEKS